MGSHDLFRVGAVPESFSFARRAADQIDSGRTRSPPKSNKPPGFRSADGLNRFNVNSEIKSLFGAAKDLRLLITSTDSEGVLDAVMPHFTGGGNALVPAKREGSGLVSLQSLFLLLHFGQERVKKGNSFVMALEEPELHLPPSIQRRILRRLQSLSTQTIISTHSPLIAGFADPTSLLAVRNAAGM